MIKIKKIISQVKLKTKQHKVLVQNFTYLSALQAFNMLLPIIVFPYLIRILGTEKYGLVVYAQAIAGYFGILVDFGFKISATKDISIHRKDKKKLSNIVSSVLIIKVFLWLVSLSMLYALITFIPTFKDEKILFLLSFGICFNEFLFPQWYFQGIEKMKYITIFNLVARLLFLCLIFIFVREKSDYLLVPLFNGLGAFFGGTLALFLIFKEHKIKFSLQPWTNIKYYFRESLPLFGSNLIISVKDKFNIIFIGSILGMREVAIYDIAIKIMKLFIQPLDIINRTIYPRVAVEKNTGLALKTAKFSFIVMLVIIIIIQPFLPFIIDLLSEGLMKAVLPTRILLLSSLIMVWSLTFGINFINALGKYKLMLKSMIFTTLFYVFMIFLGYAFSWTDFLMFYILLTVTVYLFELLYRFYIVKKYKLL